MDRLQEFVQLSTCFPLACCIFGEREEQKKHDAPEGREKKNNRLEGSMGPRNAMEYIAR